MRISIKPRGFEEIIAYAKQLPYGTKKVALEAVSEYMLGDDQHGYKHYPPLSTQAYLNHIPPSYTRTNDLKNGWEVELNDPYKPRIVNAVPYAPYVPRWKKYGWREWLQVATDNMAGAIRHANAVVREFLKSKG